MDVGLRRQTGVHHISINPFSTIAKNRISSRSSQIPSVSFIRRDVSLVNIARETENVGDEWESDITSLKHDSLSEYVEDDEAHLFNDELDDNDNNYEPSEPVRSERLVATADAKIPPLPAYSSLSPSSKTLVQQLELLYSAQSQKKLRDLTYLPSLSDSLDDQNVQDQKLISTLKQSLEDGGFRLMDQRDFDLCTALNAGYLLRLSLLPDLKDLDPTIGQQFYPEIYNESQEKSDSSLHKKLLFDGRVLVYRRGYSQEVTTGRLLLPKLDYLQASLVQRSSASLTRKLGVLEQKLEDFIARIFNQVYSTIRRWWFQLLMLLKGFILDNLKSLGLLENKLVSRILSSSDFFGVDFADMNGPSHKGEGIDASTYQNAPEYQIRGNKIFKLGRYGVGERYSTFNYIANSLDLSDSLSPFTLCEVGSNDTTSIEQDMYEGIDAGKLKCQYDEIYGPTEGSDSQSTVVRLLDRVSIQNTVNFFTENGRRDLIKNYVKESTLREPSYEEVVVVWRPLKHAKTMKKQLTKWTTLPNWFYSTARIFDMEHKLPEGLRQEQTKDLDDTPAPLEIRAFSDVPMANVLAVLPKTKLIFRPADAFVFDFVSIVSFLALGASLKFDNPRLDLLAVVSLSVFAVRTFFRYSNKYARYDLLVNKFLTKKLSHRGSGALNYIVSQADSQKALRSGLIRDWLNENKVCMTGGSNGEDPTNLRLDYDVLELGRSFANSKASTNSARIDVDILSAIEELNSLGLLDIVEEGQSVRVRIKDDQSAQENIQQLWNIILTRSL